ncbi:hypothetical protein [Pacificimonas flava]|uniref:Glycerophosphoryl diester phosphodiesterase membrane domain-containing protein n=1 Tax=Pacificimonas flava TaxID=1234595 RepID=M2TAM8_9SPHN|nr:hypothetical protein [Pacificimonas flava]EMD83649.1 hypothetical protein C725_0621 [Pacificimonas flava]MBB5280667.1 uncharacterized membrane protein YhaH (DUF805 family) [Pacificimonas flava]
MSISTGKLSLNQLWKDVQALVAARGSDLLLPAAAFIFLPNLAQGLFVAQPANPAQPDPEYSLTAIVVGLIGLAATLSIIAMVFDRRMETGAALRLAFARYGRALAAAIITGLIVFVGLLALIVPGLYLLSRLWLVMPAVTIGDGDGEGLLGPLKASWRATQGQALRSFGIFLIVVFGSLLLAVVAAAAALLDPLIGSGDMNAGRLGLFGALAAAVVSSIIGIYFAVTQARAYQMLTGRADPDAPRV